MSEIGTIFDIRQLSVFDGPGIRTTVFLMANLEDDGEDPLK